LLPPAREAAVHIAIVIPAFNLAPFLGDCLLSLLDQTHTNWSAVVVDDGSTDATNAVAARFTDRRIRLIRQRNAGVSSARNTGIGVVLRRGSAGPSLSGAAPADAWRGPDRLADDGNGIAPGAFVFLDGDDWLAPNALEVLAEALEAAPRTVAACGRYARVASNGAIRLAPPPAGGCVLERLLTGNLFANGGHLLIRREAIEAAGDFRTNLSYGEDWDYWVRLAILGEFIAVKSRAPMLFVRERPGSAYLSHGTDPRAYRPAMDVIYRNVENASRLGASRLTDLRRQADAETAWSVGRELIRHGNRIEGLFWLARSVREAPNLKRLGLIVLSVFRFGPFRLYRTAD
jgi:glycosyltransferase involved in cell wall biosynthesis